MLTLGGYAPHLAPEDAVQVVRQALELGGLGQVAFAALVELRRAGAAAGEGGKAARAVLLREADALVAAACKGGRVRMAVMVVEDVQRERVRPSPSSPRRRRQRGQGEGEEPSLAASVGQEAGAAKPPLVSRGTYLSLLRRLQQKGRPRSYWRLAEALLTYKGRPAAAVLAGDAEATGSAMVVCWKAKRWQAVQRLLRALEADGGLPPPPLLGGQEEGEGDGDGDGEDGATLRRMEALFAGLQQLQAEQQGQQQRQAVLTTEHGNMLLHARLRAGRRDAAVALAEGMMASAAAAAADGSPSESSEWLQLPPANALSVCLVLEALGRTGEWGLCLRLLQGAREALPAMDKAGLAMVYKTAIGAFCVWGRLVAGW